AVVRPVLAGTGLSARRPPRRWRKPRCARAYVAFPLLVVVRMAVVAPAVTVDLVPGLHHRRDDIGMLLGGLCADRHVGVKAVAIEGFQQAPHSRLPSILGV